MIAQDWSSARRILAVRLDGMGDLLMTGPALRALKEAVPGRTVTAIVSPAAAACAALLPGIDDFIVHKAPWMKGSGSDPEDDQALIAHLRARVFDGAVIFTVFGQSPLPAALCHLAAIPRRAAHCRENPSALRTTWIREREPQESIRHEVERQLALVGHLGARLTGVRLKIRLARRFCEQAAMYRRDSRPLIIMHPRAAAPSRRYPEASYAAVLQGLGRETEAVCILIGTEDERTLLARIRSAAASEAPVVCGVSLRASAGILDAADVVVTHNAGPAYLAAAVATPVAVPYALTNPRHAPWRAAARALSADVPCRDCFKSACPNGHHRRLKDVSPRQGVNAVIELLQEGVNAWRHALC